MQIAVLVELLDERLADLLMHLAGMPHAAALVDGQADVVGIERLLLRIVVSLHVLSDRSVEFARLDELAVPLVDGRTEAIGTRDEPHVLGPDTVAQETGVAVGRHEHAGYVSEMERLVSVGHARRDNGTLGPARFIG